MYWSACSSTASRRRRVRAHAASACRAWARFRRGRQRRPISRADAVSKAVRRIERGTAWFFLGGHSLDSDLLWIPRTHHSPMTRPVLGSLDEVEAVVPPLRPEVVPLRLVKVLAGGARGAGRRQYRLGTRSRGRRNRVSSRTLSFDRSRSNRCGTDHVRAARTRSIAAQDLQCLVDHRWGFAGGHSSSAMIKTTHARNPAGTVVAYADNRRGDARTVDRSLLSGIRGRYGYRDELTHTLMKCETTTTHGDLAFPGAADRLQAARDPRRSGDRPSETQGGVCGSRYRICASGFRARVGKRLRKTRPRRSALQSARGR